MLWWLLGFGDNDGMVMLSSMMIRSLPTRQMIWCLSRMGWSRVLKGSRLSDMRRGYLGTRTREIAACLPWLVNLLLRVTFALPFGLTRVIRCSARSTRTYGVELDSEWREAFALGPSLEVIR
jgi:hypothetical protein